MTRRILTVCAALVASSSSARADCKADAAGVVSFLRALRAASTQIAIPPKLALVARADLETTDADEVLVVTLTASGASFDGSDKDLGARLAKAHDERFEEGVYRSIHSIPNDNNERVALVIDANATWGDVVQVIAVAAKAGLPRPSLVFAAPLTLKPPPASSLDANAVAEHCPALGRLLVSERGNLRALAESAAPALTDCNRSLDLAAFRSLIWTTADGAHPTAMFELRVDKAGKRISLPAATKWSDASTQLAPGVRVNLVVKK